LFALFVKKEKRNCCAAAREFYFLFAGCGGAGEKLRERTVVASPIGQNQGLSHFWPTFGDMLI
jgi:hypothetical protein